MLPELESVIAWIKTAHNHSAIAQAAGLSRSTVTKIGAGTHTPNVATLEKLLTVKSTPPPERPIPPPAW